MKVCIAELREVANLLFDHLERSGHAEIELEIGGVVVRVGSGAKPKTIAAVIGALKGGS